MFLLAHFAGTRRLHTLATQPPCDQSCRSLSAALSPEEEPQDSPPETERGPPSTDDLYRAVVAVLYLAEAAGRLLVAKTPRSTASRKGLARRWASLALWK